MNTPMSIRMGQSLRAHEEFRHARNRALAQKFFATLQRQPGGLLCFEAVRAQLGFRGMANSGLQEIDIDKVVGSVGRAHDFAANFQPLRETSKDRWLQIRLAHAEMRDLPPIEVFQIDDAYFVIDGHHRVSVARTMKLISIAAMVTKVETVRPFAEYAAHRDERGVRAWELPQIIPSARNWLAARLIHGGRFLQNLGDPCSCASFGA